MLEDAEGPLDDRRSARADALRLALAEDLDLYAREDLEDRIAQLEAEIVRTRAALDRKRSGRAAADALFSLGGA